MSFEDHRNYLFAVAYRILGSAADAEDAVQDAWISWSSADRSGVAEPRAYLVRIVTNLAVDRLRSGQRRRETYVGPWLPEPVLTGPDIAESAERAESVSLAMLVVLERLTPLERAVFVLKDVFGVPHTEIAVAIDRSEATVRQLAHRARAHVEEHRPRFRASPQEKKAATDRFLAAATGGDINALMEVLAPDVTLWTDGGGKVRQALRPVVGAERVAPWLTGVASRPYEGVAIEDMVFTTVELNGGPALFVSSPAGPLATLSVDLDADGRVTTVHNIANPDKLAPLAKGASLAF
ncbi:RNA polymerase sigma-70 factor [Actinocorallia longicatena]|uniref:RNA polymerase sigma-70 factor n=1 Tax=Actinocorallia longicatena TaxID=111803 RepID=A0ABP6QHJ2_9ACTN